MTKVGGIRKIMVLWQAVFLAASPLVTAPSSNLTRILHNTASYAGYFHDCNDSKNVFKAEIYVLKNHEMTCGIENRIYILGKF